MERWEFDQHYKRLFVPLCHKAYSMINDRDSAKDIVQSVFINFWNKNPTLNGPVDAYLYKAVINQSLNYLDSHARRSLAISSHTATRDLSFNNVEQSINEAELRQNIEQVLNNLPPACKRVFMLSRFEGMSYKAIATFLNISENTVDNHIKHALQLFRKFLPALLPIISKIF